MENFWLILKIILYTLGIVSIVLTVLPLFKLSAWWFRIGDFPRIQIAVIAVITAILLLAFYPYNAVETAFIALLFLSAAYQIFRVLPYLPFYPRQVEAVKEFEEKNSVKLLISNVFMENEETERLKKLIGSVKPDLFLLAEVNGKWAEAVSEFETDYPYNLLYPLENTYGLILYSKFELENSEIKFLIEDDIPSFHTSFKLPSGKSVKLFCLHPRPPVPTENTRSLERDGELLLVGKIVEKLDEPTIVAGDLNDVAWSRTTNLFQKISGLLDPRIGRGLYNSFHADHWFLRFPLDHVFHSNHFRLADLQRMPSVGSDHFPIFVHLSLEKTAELTQEEPEANGDEKREADETIIEAVETVEAEKSEKSGGQYNFHHGEPGENSLKFGQKNIL